MGVKSKHTGWYAIIDSSFAYLHIRFLQTNLQHTKLQKLAVRRLTHILR